MRDSRAANVSLAKSPACRSALGMLWGLPAFLVRADNQQQQVQQVLGTLVCKNKEAGAEEASSIRVYRNTNRHNPRGPRGDVTSAAAFNLHGHPSTFFVLQVGGMPPASIHHVGRSSFFLFLIQCTLGSTGHSLPSPLFPGSRTLTNAEGQSSRG